MASSYNMVLRETTYAKSNDGSVTETLTSGTATSAASVTATQNLRPLLASRVLPSKPFSKTTIVPADASKRLLKEKVATQQIGSARVAALGIGRRTGLNARQIVTSSWKMRKRERDLYGIAVRGFDSSLSLCFESRRRPRCGGRVWYFSEARNGQLR